MCGIFAYISSLKINSKKKIEIIKEFMKIQYRGPDNTKYNMETEKIFFGFHRLSINDLSENGNQPFVHPQDLNIRLICNGEIYNYKNLCSQFNIKMNSDSDCEVILHLYKKIGFTETIKLLDGVFACVLLDLNNNTVYAARDPIGVRSMFIGKSQNNIVIASELKSLHKLCDDIKQFKPGCIWDSKKAVFESYYNHKEIYNNINETEDLNIILKSIKDKFTSAVNKRLMSDRPIGCLLSGGLDSSLVAAVLTKLYKHKLRTFSIGLKGSPDLKYAKMVANYINSDHHEIIVTEKQMIDALERNIYQIETYDTTTIRASTPMMLLCEYIKNSTNTTVIYSGEGSDEASGSYLYFHNAPNSKSFHSETVRLMEDLCYFDVLRCDKSIATTGLEVRVPFLDKDFLNYYMNIDPRFKHPDYGDIEKYMLRKAFDNRLLPEDVLWRTKEAMSDGISKKENSWFSIIQNKVNKIYTDAEFKQKQNKYEKNKPMLKESLYYRELFANDYKLQDNIIPYYWLPKWCGDIVEPSARILKI